MTDKELVANLLELMGYEDEEISLWWYKDDAKWHAGDILHIPERYAFAAEVKEFMANKGYGYCEQWLFMEDTYNDKEAGYIEFCKDDPCDGGANTIEFTSQDQAPRAICEAAIAALKGEPCS